MEAFTQVLPIISGLLLIALTYLCIRTIGNNTRKVNKNVAPEPSGAWPLIGHLQLLQSQTPAARILGKIADEYGPVFSLRLGSRRAVVVSSLETIQECLGTNDKKVLSRPDIAASRYMVYDNTSFGLAPYGPYWKEMRKLVMSKLFTSQCLEKFKNVRDSEVMNFIKELSVWSLKNRDGMSIIKLDKWFEQITVSINMRMLVGKRCSEGNNEDTRVKEAIKKGLQIIGAFVMSDHIPSLEWMDIGGHIKTMKQMGNEFDGVIQKWLDEHIEKKKENDLDSDQETDFMDVMLSTLSKDAEIFGHGRETIIKATTLILMLTGSESVAETMTWTLSLLLNNPAILKACQKEIDIYVGREKWVEESDIKNLSYLQAIVKETLRMYPPGPLSAPREAVEDCNIGGYYISKGTRLIVNIWKLHHDPQIWPDPFDFRPERFLEEHSNVNYQGQNFEYIPFSSGRRMCPATTFALRLIHLTLARLIQGFDLSTPMGTPVDMTEASGQSLPKTKPLEAIITPRLPGELYQML